jgi:hypothetical protein
MFWEAFPQVATFYMVCLEERTKQETEGYTLNSADRVTETDDALALPAKHISFSSEVPC